MKKTVPKKIHRRHLVTLIEVMIALGLASLIMTTMFYFYQKAARLDAEIKKVEEQVFSLRLLESQLMRILPKSMSRDVAERDFFFVTGTSDQISKAGTPYLLFSYDRGVDLDPLFSNIVLGRLFVDKKNRLILATFPAPTRWVQNQSPPMKREVLMENVESIAFSFYIPPEKGSTKESKEKQSPVLRGVITSAPETKGEFVKEWKNEYGVLPPLMKMEIEIKRGGVTEKKVFPFSLPYAKETITYSTAG